MMTQPVQIDLSQAPEVTCGKCENNVFLQGMQFRKISAILSPTGEEGMVPIPAFVCSKCGQSLREEEEDTTSSPILGA